MKALWRNWHTTQVLFVHAGVFHGEGSLSTWQTLSLDVFVSKVPNEEGTSPDCSFWKVLGGKKIYIGIKSELGFGVHSKIFYSWMLHVYNQLNCVKTLGSMEVCSWEPGFAWSCAPFLLGRYDKHFCPAHLILPSAVGIAPWVISSRASSRFCSKLEQVREVIFILAHWLWGMLHWAGAMLSIKELLGVCL